jgi:hypothetical protein
MKLVTQKSNRTVVQLFAFQIGALCRPIVLRHAGKMVPAVRGLRLTGSAKQSIAPQVEAWIASLRSQRRGGHSFFLLATDGARGLNFSWPSLKSEGAGKTGCTPHPRSRVRFAQTKMHTSIQVQANTLRPSLRNGFTAYFVLFPENGSFASVVGGTLPANVMPAPRHQNHTTSPYASGAYV